MMNAHAKRLFGLLTSLLFVVLSACGADEGASAEGEQPIADADAGGALDAGASSSAQGSSVAGDADPSSQGAEPAVAPSAAEIEAACEAYCVFDNETCPDPSADAVNDTQACEADCLDAENPAGLSAAALKSAECYAQTSAYLACLEELSCEGYDAHLEGLAMPDYFDECTLLLADEACS